MLQYRETDELNHPCHSRLWLSPPLAPPLPKLYLKSLHRHFPLNGEIIGVNKIVWRGNICTHAKPEFLPGPSMTSCTDYLYIIAIQKPCRGGDMVAQGNVLG